MHNAFVVGYYGFGNLGDELLKSATIRILREAHFEKIYLTLPSKFSKLNLRSNYSDSVSRFDPVDVFSAILNSKIIVAGGGGIFQDETSTRSFLYYWSVLYAAVMFKKRVMLLGNSFGPVSKRFCKMLLKHLLSSPRVISIPRDSVSERYCRIIGAKVIGGTDLAILELMGRDLQTQITPQVSLILREKIDISEALSVLSEQNIDTVKIVPLSLEDEQVASKMASTLSRNFNVSVEYDDPIATIARSSLVISQRFHGCLIASFYGIPFVSVHSTKTERFMKRYLPSYQGYSDKNPAEIALRAYKILGSEIQIREKLIADALQMKDNVMKILNSKL